MDNQISEGSLVSTLVTAAIAEDNLYKKIRMTNSIIYALDEETITELEIDPYHKKLKKLILDIDFLRKLKLNSVLKENPQSAVEYLGKDYIGGDDNFKYDNDFENLLANIKFDTEQILGRIVKHLSKEKGAISFTGAEL